MIPRRSEVNSTAYHHNSLAAKQGKLSHEAGKMGGEQAIGNAATMNEGLGSAGGHSLRPSSIKDFKISRQGGVSGAKCQAAALVMSHEGRTLVTSKGTATGTGG
jgi:hypothetical protein